MEYDMLFPYMVTWVTHNSRISERMVKFGVQRGTPVILGAQGEVFIAQVIKEIVVKDDLRIMAFNICRDHVHMVIVCSPGGLSKIIGRLKGVTSRKYNTKFNKGVNPLVSRYADGTIQHLWAQKFHRTQISDVGYALEDAVYYI